MRKLSIPTIAAIALISCSSASSEVRVGQNNNAPDLKFDLPIKCTLGTDCYILNYTDRDPGPEAVDFGCGRMTYNGHTGTDFAILNERVMRQGIPVLASANGKVLRLRDGVVDLKNTDIKDPRVAGKECGNGVLIDHGNGWETQYCHMRQGSVVVKPGTVVKSGTVLGFVGESGAASFPHVHFEARYKGKPVDPFLGVDAQIEKQPGCKVPAKSMWKTPITYVPTGLMNAGFADHPPKLEDAEQGTLDDIKLNANAPAILFWVRIYGVLKGDVQHIRLIAPDGSVAASSDRNVQKDTRMWMLFAGKRNKPDQKLATGNWRGEYQIIRDGKTLVDVKREIKVK